MTEGLLDRILTGKLRLVSIAPDGTEFATPPDRAVVLAGSFNPLHVGHERLLAAASALTGRAPAYELSVTNVDKPQLSTADVLLRLSQFRGKGLVVITRAPTFVEKSELMPGTLFAIGYDTATRLFTERYYPRYDAKADLSRAGSAVALAFNTLRRNHCGFVIAGRAGSDGRFRTVADLAAPPEFRDMLTELPESAFRADISSTQLRAARRGLTVPDSTGTMA